MNPLRSQFGLLLAVSLMPLFIGGCAAKRMKADFISFEKAYAETSNREELLNLARLQNHDPTYFFKLGQISSSYRMQASMTGTGNKVIQGNLGAAVTGGGTPGLIYENDPSFTFIPVNDDTSAQLLLKPVPAETFYNLYLQGWRVDQLFRLMVDRIELAIPNSDGKTCAVQTIRNVPPPAYPKTNAGDAEYVREANDYATFLRISALAYGLQKHGHLLLKGSVRFIPMDTKSTITGESGQNAPKATELAAAAAKNQSWEYDGTKWMLGQQIFSAEFFLNPRPGASSGDPNRTTIEDNIEKDGRMKGLKRDDPAFNNALNVLANGFSIEGVPAAGQQVYDACQPEKGVSAHLIMRSLIGLMAAAAQEETPFDALTKDNIAHIRDSVPPIEQLPALR